MNRECFTCRHWEMRTMNDATGGIGACWMTREDFHGVIVAASTNARWVCTSWAADAESDPCPPAPQ